MTRAIIYTRVSTTEQQEKGYSLFEQQRICVRYCQDKRYSLVTVISDASSGFKFDRPGMEELKKYLPEANIVLATEIDRIARQDRVLGKIELLCEQNNAKLEFVFEERDTKGSTLISDVKVATAKEENYMRMMRVQRGKKAKHSLGGHIARAPFGYKFDKNVRPSQLVPNNDHGLVQSIFNLRADNITYMQIVEKLSLYTSKKQIGLSDVAKIMGLKKIISNPVYLGYVSFQGNLRRGKHVSATDEKIFLKANKCTSFEEFCKRNKLKLMENN
jgi:site-specific DNA recombinase